MIVSLLATVVNVCRLCDAPVILCDAPVLPVLPRNTTVSVATVVSGHGHTEVRSLKTFGSWAVGRCALFLTERVAAAGTGMYYYNSYSLSGANMIVGVGFEYSASLCGAPCLPIYL